MQPSDVLQTADSKSSLWFISRNVCVVETFDPKVAERLRRLSYTTERSLVGVNHYRRQFTIPARKRRSVMRSLGIPYGKNRNRVAAGQRAAAQQPISRGQP